MDLPIAPTLVDLNFQLYYTVLINEMIASQELSLKEFQWETVKVSSTKQASQRIETFGWEMHIQPWHRECWNTYPCVPENMDPSFELPWTSHKLKQNLQPDKWPRKIWVSWNTKESNIKKLRKPTNNNKNNKQKKNY